MGQNQSQHPKRKDDPGRGPQEARDRGEPKESGVVPTRMVNWLRKLRNLEPWLPGDDPPWAVVEQHLSQREGDAWIEEHARKSRAFAHVLEVTRNQGEDAQDDDADPFEVDEESPPSSRPSIPLEN